VFLVSATTGRKVAARQFVVKNDREILLATLEDVPPSEYFLEVENIARRVARSKRVFRVARSLSFRGGGRASGEQNTWQFAARPRFVFNAGAPAAMAFFALCALVAALTARGVAVALRERRTLSLETHALISGELLAKEKKRKLDDIQNHGIGLRGKLLSFTITLVIVTVSMIAVPLYVVMVRTHLYTLKKSLFDRVSVLLGSLESEIKTFLPRAYIPALESLPEQLRAVPEVNYVTITGFGAKTTAGSCDYVWASNDPDILEKIDTSRLIPGVSRITDEMQSAITAKESLLNEAGRQELATRPATLASLKAQLTALEGRNDSASVRRKARLNATAQAVAREIQQILDSLSQQVYSQPVYRYNEAEETGVRYFFFTPVMYLAPRSARYVRGWIQLSVSSASIVKALRSEQRDTLRLIGLVALIAMALGATGAFVFALLLIRPIRTLVKFVRLIRDTEDKTKLEGKEIVTRSLGPIETIREANGKHWPQQALHGRDEIGVLADTINEMTRGLVTAAQASKELLVGREIQKKFIPLEMDSAGNKLSTGSFATERAEFFGYYEGAKGVSGDYFDYRDLDGRRFAIIKCDIAGKGISAALIMVQVATMFVNFFRRWMRERREIDDLVYEINDFIEKLGFSGRFAAFTLGLFDTETGKLTFCNAGDSLVHYYDASALRFKTLRLPQTPAAGVLSNAVIAAAGGYKTNSFHLDHDDILLLYTDGIEETKRVFRDSRFAQISCTASAPGTTHGTHTAGQSTEALGAQRVEAIVNAVMNARQYTLFKYHNPHGDIQYHFDFATCSGAVEELILALVSVEKVFRLWKGPHISNTRVLVDKKIDLFLRRHFVEYYTYLPDVREVPDNPGYYLYNDINEDEQSDDLTIIGIRRK
jgi:serine phosphatase RsbU (regulator of sigma subunit)